MSIRRIFLLLIINSILTMQGFGTGRDVVILLDSLPEKIDPFEVINKNSHLIVKQICERLIYFSTTGEYRGELAKSWNFSNGGRKLLIEIVGGQRFSDGSILQSQDVVTMIENVVKKGFISGFLNIKGARKFASGQASKISGVTVPMSNQILLDFDKDYFEILNDFSDVQTSLCKRIDGVLIGTGKFRLNILPRKGHESLFIQRVEKPIFDAEPVQIEFVTNTMQRKVNISFSTKQHPEYLEMRMPYFEPKTIFVGFNASTKYGKDKGIRESIARAINSTKSLPNASSQPSFIPRSFIRFTGLKKKPAAEVGTLQFPREDLEIYSYTEELMDSIKFVCELLMNGGFKHKCQPRITSFEDFKRHLKEGKASIFVARLSPSKPSATDLITVFDRSSALNYYFSGPVSPLELKIQLLNRQIFRSMADREKYVSYLEELNSLIMDEFLVVPLSDGSEQYIAFDRSLSVPQIGILGIIDYDLSKVRW